MDHHGSVYPSIAGGGGIRIVRCVSVRIGACRRVPQVAGAVRRVSYRFLAYPWLPRNVSTYLARVFPHQADIPSWGIYTNSCAPADLI